MSENIKIGVIGGDERQITVAKRLSRKYECAVWGLDEVPERAVRCGTWQSAVKGADSLILPLPVSRDGEKLNASEDVLIEDIIELVSPGTLVFGGMMPSDLKSLIRERGAEYYDYYDSEVVQIKNAVPTAEGTIAAMINEMPTTLYGMSVTVTGYGRCARALSSRLVALGATVYVAARKESALAWAAIEGCIPVPMGEYLFMPHDSDAIVNTVPVKLFDDNVLSGMDPKTVYFELAGGDGGIDAAAAEKYGIKVVTLHSLPGKTSPETAGDIIASELFGRLDEHFGEDVDT